MSGKIYKSIGPTFVNIGNTDGTFTLQNVLTVSEEYSPDDDWLFVINPSDCSNDREIVYVDGLGWYDAKEEEMVSDEPFDIGTGFQTSFSGGNVILTSAGEVYQDGYTIPCAGKCYMELINATGREITWSELTITGDYSVDDDWFFVINPDDCSNDREIVYIEGTGWYDAKEEEMVDDLPIPAGEGFQTAFGAAGEFSISFPET